MSKASDAANAVVNAVEQVLDLYGVAHTREQSRVIQVEGAAGRFRPMYFGKWIDDDGNVHTSGKADLLARPRVHISSISGAICHSKGCGGYGADSLSNNLWTTSSARWRDCTCGLVDARISIPFWIECKSGKGTLSHDQRAFRAWVLANGDEYMLVHDDVRPLIEWLEAHGVKKQPKRIIHSENAIDSGQLEALPCRHCDLTLDKHIGPAHGCPGRRTTVWSPKLRTESNHAKTACKA
jgi:hypothetical protein